MLLKRDLLRLGIMLLFMALFALIVIFVGQGMLGATLLVLNIFGCAWLFEHIKARLEEAS